MSTLQMANIQTDSFWSRVGCFLFAMCRAANAKKEAVKPITQADMLQIMCSMRAGYRRMTETQPSLVSLMMALGLWGLCSCRREKQT